jgi:hypothetical protein
LPAVVEVAVELFAERLGEEGETASGFARRHGRWSMVNGRWSMVHGGWFRVHGRWLMVDG